MVVLEEKREAVDVIGTAGFGPGARPQPKD
jgi:hypothetical protein